MKIPFLDMTAPYLELRSELDAAYRRVMESGQYILGEEVEAFEAEFAAYCGARHCIGVGNGLEALHLILRACGIGSGDEVIIPANTYIATWLAVSYSGATPVPVEPDNKTFNLDPTLVERRVTEQDPGDPAGTSVRSDGGHEAVDGDRATTQSAGHRRCGAGTRRGAGRPPRRRTWRRGRLELLSFQEPGGDG